MDLKNPKKLFKLSQKSLPVNNSEDSLLKYFINIAYYLGIITFKLEFNPFSEEFFAKNQKYSWIISGIFMPFLTICGNIAYLNLWRKARRELTISETSLYYSEIFIFIYSMACIICFNLSNGDYFARICTEIHKIRRNLNIQLKTTRNLLMKSTLIFIFVINVFQAFLFYQWRIQKRTFSQYLSFCFNDFNILIGDSDFLTDDEVEDINLQTFEKIIGIFLVFSKFIGQTISLVAFYLCLICTVELYTIVKLILNSSEYFTQVKIVEYIRKLFNLSELINRAVGIQFLLMILFQLSFAGSILKRLVISSSFSVKLVAFMLFFVDFLILILATKANSLSYKFIDELEKKSESNGHFEKDFSLVISRISKNDIGIRANTFFTISNSFAANILTLFGSYAVIMLQFE